LMTKLILLFLVSEKNQEDEKTKRVGLLLESSNEKVNKRMKLLCLETNLNIKRMLLFITTEDNWKSTQLQRILKHNLLPTFILSFFFCLTFFKNSDFKITC
jgi:hypothetical protein